MSSFTKPIRVEYIAHDEWVLLEDFLYYTDDGVDIVVPAGFVTDFASVPRILWPIFPPMGETYCKAAVVHDYLVNNDSEFTRKEIDVIFCNGMKILGASFGVRWLFYLAVRIESIWQR